MKLEERLKYWFVDKVTDIGIKCHLEEDKIIMDKLVVNTNPDFTNDVLSERGEPWYPLNRLKKYVGKEFPKSEFNSYTDYSRLSKTFGDWENVVDYKTYLENNVKPAERGLYDY